ncbi:hypothetical protein HHI36_002930 [Cryptolaemus montrouzieri]|uniref:Protein O-mannosyl-transferase C-terminal four TM domain-containing protein n=1 Tax=Cryptolaemus montrouzieri TaxID=559131 RepID=A0ABD2PCJ8_9CUCU
MYIKYWNICSCPISGQFFSGAGYRIYLLGNPIIWWGNLLFLLIFAIVFISNAIKLQRGYIKHFKDNHSLKLKACAWLFVGWMLHYIPFWAMGRVLYFHHYFPAVIFSSLISGIIIDYLLDDIQELFAPYMANTVYHTTLVTILSTMIYSFYLFSPLAYGMDGPSSNESNSTMYGLRWMESWEF